MASSSASKTVPVHNTVPNKRERAASQYGEISNLVAGSWSSSSGVPTSIQSAINRLAASMVALLAKLDADAGVTDTNYASTLKP